LKIEVLKMSSVIDLTSFEKRMKGAYEMLEKEFQGLRTGRASVNLLDNVVVEVYGSKVPISHVASVSAPESRLLTVQVWDNANVKSVEKAIGNAGLGLNPQPAGNLIRVPLPELTEERRIEISKVAGKYSEQAKIAIRNIRREAMDLAKKEEKDGTLSKDELKRAEEDVQKLTDKWVGMIDKSTEKKEEEIKQV